MSPFYFHTKLDQTLLLGTKAGNVRELLEKLTSVPHMSIYYHTHRFLQQHHYLSPEPPNDFAYWVTDVLNDAPLGERLSSVDIIQFNTIEDLKASFVRILEEHLADAERIPDCTPGEEFHFMSCKTFVMQTPHAASSLAEFSDCLARVSVNSLYYHVFDAKLRLARGQNDFSRWFGDMGLMELSEAVAQLDPYTYTLEGLRNRILKLVRQHDRT
jgi:hypothetical protein